MRGKIISRQGLLAVAVVLVAFSEGIKAVVGFPIVHVGNAIIFALFAEIFLVKFIKEFKRQEKFRVSSETRLIWAWFAAFMIIGSAAALLFHPDLFLYIWSIRSYLRFFALFIDCIYIFADVPEDIFFKALEVAVVMHIAITLVQFVFLGLRWDYVNGIFGDYMGGSSGVNALLLVNTCACFYRFYLKKLRMGWLFFHIAWMVANAAVSEIKVYFLELIFIAIVYTVITGQYKAMVKIWPAIVLLVLFGTTLLGIIYPYTQGTEFLVQAYDVAATPHHDNLDSLSRITQFSGMTDPILSYAHSIRENSGLTALITGLGFGSAEYGTREIFVSEFFKSNDRLWYCDYLGSLLYAETGIIGICIYNSLWIFMCIKGAIAYRRGENDTELLKILLAVSMGFMSLYDMSMRNNYGYIIWVAAAVLFIRDKKEQVSEYQKAS